MRKILSKVLAMVLALALVVPMIPMKADAAVTGGQAIAMGIDVSKWQGNVNWAAVRSSGVQFAFIKAYSAKSGVDPYFAQNIVNANAQGIRTGVYVYSYATSVEAAVNEANAVLSVIQNYPVSYPVAIDIEDSSQKGLSPDQLAAIANAFCATIENAGYYPMVYANKSWFNTRIGAVAYDKWVAQYSNACDYGQVPCIWQASCTASIPGVGGQVDLDYLYKDYSFIVAQGFSVVGNYKYFYNNYRRQRGWVEYAGQRYFCDPVYSFVRTGWLDGGGFFYYLGDDGAMSTGFRQIGTDTYYFGTDGIMRTGNVDVGTDKYLFAGDGKMYTGWWTPGDYMYFYGADGKMVFGFNDIAGARYYFNAAGQMQIGLQTIANQVYYFNEKGQMQTGMVPTVAGNMYFGADGVRAKGLITLPDVIRYFDPKTGVMQVGFVNFPEGTRYFDPATGVMATGLTATVNGKCYFDGNGLMYKGLVALQDGTYYFDATTGAMATGIISLPDGIRYFDAAGHMQVGLVDVGTTKYYANPANGVLVAGLVSDAKGVRYFDPADYHMCTGITVISGASFYLDPTTGYLVTGKNVTWNGHTYACDANGVATLIK